MFVSGFSGLPPVAALENPKKRVQDVLGPRGPSVDPETNRGIVNSQGISNSAIQPRGGGTGGMSMTGSDYERLMSQANIAAELAQKYSEQRKGALAEGRVRGEELFGKGSLGRLDATRGAETQALLQQRQQMAAPSAVEQQVMALRQQNLQGMTPNELAALRSTQAQLANRQFQGQSRALSQQLGQTGLRGAQRAVQFRKLGEAQSGQMAQQERDMYLQNLQMQRQAQDQLEATGAAQLQRQSQGLSLYEQALQNALAQQRQAEQFNISQTEKELAGRLATEQGAGSQAALDQAAANALLAGLQGQNQQYALMQTILGNRG